MSSFLLIREQVKELYAKYEVFITPALKFLLAFAAFSMINSNVGYFTRLNSLFTLLLHLLIISVL